MATGEIKTIYSDSEKTNPVFPRTKINAVSDTNGTGLNVYLNSIVYAEDGELAEPAVAPYDADTLGGVAAENYALKTDIPEFDDTLSIENCIADAKVVGEKFGETTSLVKRVGNPYNLLDNSDFRNPVNQRGFTVHTGSRIYALDRWTLESASGESYYDIGNKWFALQNNAFLCQPIWDKASFEGKTYTLSVCDHLDRIHTSKMVFDSLPTAEGENKSYGNSDGVVNIFCQIAGHLDSAYFYIINQSGNLLGIKWAALYEGEYTLETLPEYQPKGYAHELLECQRYFYKIKAYWKFAYFGICTSTTHADININLPVAMRTTPTVTIDDASLIKVKCGSNSSQVPSEIAWNACNTAINDSMNMGCTVTNATAGSIAALYFDNGGIIKFSADL